MDLKEATALMRDGALCRRKSWGDKEPTALTLTADSVVAASATNEPLQRQLHNLGCWRLQIEERLDALYVLDTVASMVCGFPLTYADIFADDWHTVLAPLA